MFAERVESALDAAKADLPPGEWSARITLSKRGSAEALITRGGDQATAYPVIAVDVMDRPLQQQDVLELADAVAAMLLQEQFSYGPAGPGSDKSKRLG